MRRPRKIAIKLVLFLLLGAIVNVAVAWCCAVRPEGALTTFERDDPDVPYTMISFERGRVTIVQDGPTVHRSELRLAPPNSMIETKYKSIVPPWSSFARGEPSAALTNPDQMDGSILRQYAECATGWPLLSLMSAQQAWFGFDVREPTLRGALRISSSVPTGFPERVLPLRPIWPGFAINTFFYAAVLWLLFAAPGTVKRIMRRMKGQCLHCGYDLRGQPSPPQEESIKCPECGRSAL